MELIRVPLLNANEDEVEVVELRVAENQAVRAGDVLCLVESSKASMDVEAPAAGFVRALRVRQGQRVAVGAVICAITASASEPVEIAAAPAGQSAGAASAERVTRKARELAAAHGVEAESVAAEGIIKEADVRAFLERQGRLPPIEARPPLAAKPQTLPLLLYGSSGHAKVLIDLVRASCREWTIVGAVDDAPAAAEVLGVPVVGASQALPRLRAAGIGHAALGIGSVADHRARRRFYARLKDEGFTLPNLVHHHAALEPSVTLGAGNQVFAGAIVGSAVSVGDSVIINSGAVVSHDCQISSHVHLAPGCLLAGGVRVGENTLVGMGVTVYLGVRIGAGVVISNGACVMKDVPDGAVVRASARGEQP